MFKLFFKREKKHRKRTFLMKHFYIHTLKKDFKKAMGVYPDLENPKTFSEKNPVAEITLQRSYYDGLCR